MTSTNTASSRKPEVSSSLATRRFSFRAILAATDLSAEGRTSITLAARLAKQFHSRLYVLHAVMPEEAVVGMGGVTPVLEELDLNQVRERLHDYALRIPELKTVKHEELVLCTNPQAAIEMTVASKHIDLLVMGSHGRHGIQKLAMGSVAEWAIRHLRCPIFVAGPKCNRTLRAEQPILFACDLKAVSLRSAEFAASMAREYGGELTTMHVLPRTGSMEPLPEQKQSTLLKLRRLLPEDTREGCNLHFEVEAGDVAETVLKVASRRKARIIVLGARNKRFLADHAPWAALSKIISGAHCPVLVISHAT